MTLGAPIRSVCTRGHDMSITRKRHPNGDSYCSACKSERYTKFRKENPDKVSKYSKKSRIRKVYGIEFSEYENLLKDQNYVCAICNGPSLNEKSLHIDHCHDSGDVRGLLCHNCNTGIGLFKDNIELMKSAIKYLAKAGKSRKKKSKK